MGESVDARAEQDARAVTGPAPDAPAESAARYDVRHLGLRLRELRRDHGSTIRDLALRSGVPASTISKLETGRLKPRLVHAINLAAALDTNLGFLVDRFRSRPSSRSIVTREGRSEIRYPEMGLSLQDLSTNFIPGLLEARLGHLQPGAHSGSEPMRHPGEEFCLVLERRIRYEIDDAVHELGPGDSIHFKSDLPHRWENAARRATVVLWVFSDGLSF